MKPQSCKAKGRRLQQKIAQDIIESFPELNSDDCFSTSMGCGGEDIKMSPLARSCIPLSIEAKNQEKLNIWDAYSQCVKNCPENATPCVVFKKNGTDVYAMIPWKTLLHLYSEKRSSSNRVNPRILNLLQELMTIVTNEDALDSE